MVQHLSILGVQCVLDNAGYMRKVSLVSTATPLLSMPFLLMAVWRPQEGSLVMYCIKSDVRVLGCCIILDTKELSDMITCIWPTA
jgi:hypothetical protein